MNLRPADHSQDTTADRSPGLPQQPSSPRVELTDMDVRFILLAVDDYALKNADEALPFMRESFDRIRTELSAYLGIR